MLINLLIIIGSIYILFILIFYFGQDLFFFRPEKLPQYFRYRYAFPFDEVNFDMEDGGTINGIHFKVPNSKGVVFYFKGNSRSIKGWGKFAKDFVSKGYDFFIIDYRGFGKSRGKRTEAILYNDAQHVYKWLSSHYDEKKIILYGRSLGSGIAARIASWNNPRMLILDAPYYSFLRQIKRYGFLLPIDWLLKYRLRTDQFITQIHCPIFFIHGSKDRLISFNHSKMLQALAPSNSYLFEIKEAGHNNMPDFPQYHDILYDILNDDKIFERFSGHPPDTKRA